MKSEGALLVSWRLIPLILLAVGSPLTPALHGQPILTPEQAASTLTAVDPNSVPVNATFWYSYGVSKNGSGVSAPLPMNPFRSNSIVSVPVYYLGPGQYFLGATPDD